MNISNIALCSAALSLSLAACAPHVDGGGYGTAPQEVEPVDVEAPACDGAELHVVGLYDPYSAARDTLGPAHVHLDRPGTSVLFLSSYTATEWTVTVGPDTELLRVIAHGYENQTVLAPPGVETLTIAAVTGAEFLGCGYEYPDTDPISGCETPELLSAVEAYVGLPVSSFHGCYAASDFTIGADLSSSSDCAVEMGYSHTSVVTGACGEDPEPPPEPPCN